MATSNTIKAITTAASVSPEQPSIKIFTTASAMALMWEKSYKQMTAKEMEWFADGAAEQVGNDIRALSAVVEDTACLLASDEVSGAFQTAESASNLLFNLHNQLDAIAGMAEVSEQANWFASRAQKVPKAA